MQMSGVGVGIQIFCNTEWQDSDGVGIQIFRITE